MTSSFAARLDALSDWRSALVRRVDGLARYAGEHRLLDEACTAQLAAMRERLGQEKLIVAFVAEFSRGKSELINAIFFADTGRRVLPATPGRTTMCPVELAWQGDEPACLRLLPIETRIEGLSLSELRSQPRAWRSLPLDVTAPEQLSQSLLEVMRTEWVTQERAQALGFWHDDEPQRNPPVDDTGRVQVPAWRHALINYPHPLLRQGLVVLDTPGLNAIGAEPELTVSLLPSAHATVFILGADTGVTQSDMTVWRDHLGTQSMARFVVLNKIDALLDPLATAAEVRAQIDAQQHDTARTLGVPVGRVFPLSARQALAARVAGDADGLAQSRLPALEAALGAELLPQRRQVLEGMVRDGALQVDAFIARGIGDARRQLAEQMLELRGLRGKSAAKVRAMLQRVEAETAEFEQCTARLQALRAVHGRMLKEALAGLSSDRLRGEVQQMQAEMNASVLNLGARKAFIALCARLRRRLGTSQRHCSEIHEMLGASFTRLNAEFGFALAVNATPDLQRFDVELKLIESSYVQYLGLTHALRLSQPRFMEQFRRMLLSKLRVTFENASGEIDLWNRSASSQLDAQLRDRRRGFARRREALERIHGAAGDLEQRLVEIEAQDQRLQQVLSSAQSLTAALREQAQTPPRDAASNRESAAHADVDEGAPLLQSALA